MLEHGQISLSATVIIKNLPYATRFAVVKSLIGAHGEIKRLVLPPAGVLAIAEMASADQARKVVQSLAYSKMNGSIIYAERLPDNLWQLETTSSSDDITAPQGSMPAGEPDPSLFVVNLPRDITKQTLAASFTSFPGLLGVTLPGSQAESKGYAFVHFETAAQAEVALSGMHGTVIGGRTVRMTFSQKKAASQEYVAAPDKAASTHKDAQSTQLVLKNLPFESTRQDLLDILRQATAYQLHSACHVLTSFRPVSLALSEHCVYRKSRAIACGGLPLCSMRQKTKLVQLSMA